MDKIILIYVKSTFNCLLVKKPQTLKLILKSEDLKTENCYNIYVFPKLKLPDLDKFYIFETLNDEAKKGIRKGQTHTSDSQS